MTLKRLTQRELEVLRHLADGKTNAQIGKSMFIGETTVKTFVRKIIKKLGCISRTGAAVWYVTQVLDPEVRAQWLSTRAARDFAQAVKELSADDLKVLDLLASNPDLSNAQIGRHFFKSEDTIKTVVRRIAVTCGVSGAGARTILAVRRRLMWDSALPPSS